MILVVKNLEISMFLGIYEVEKIVQARVLIDLEIETEDIPLTAKNDLSNFVNYDILVCKIKDMFEGSRHDLIEDLVFEIACVVKHQKYPIKSLNIKVFKFGTHDFISNISIEVFFNALFLENA